MTTSRKILPYATRFIKSLVKATAKLEVFPMVGRLVPEFEGYTIVRKGITETSDSFLRINQYFSNPSIVSSDTHACN